jgi:predicted NAD/FAD-dependent oxidoreductase
MSEPKPSVVIVGGDFAGAGCAKELADHDDDGEASPAATSS